MTKYCIYNTWKALFPAQFMRKSFSNVGRQRPAALIHLHALLCCHPSWLQGHCLKLKPLVVAFHECRTHKRTNYIWAIGVKLRVSAVFDVWSLHPANTHSLLMLGQRCFGCRENVSCGFQVNVSWKVEECCYPALITISTSLDLIAAQAEKQIQA